MYPDDSIQALVGDWWVEDKARDYRRGRLVLAYLPHVSQIPNELIVKGRGDPLSHDTADFEIRPLRMSERMPDQSLPVAAMPLYRGERRGIYRVKKRPAILVNSGGQEVPRELRQGSAKYQTSPSILAVPAYGADQDGNRSGFRQELVKRIRRCEYPQYFWDKLPIPGSKDSIIRFDHLQPIGYHHESVEFTEYVLSTDALLIFNEWITWLIQGELPVDGILGDIREELLKM